MWVLWHILTDASRLVNAVCRIGVQPVLHVLLRQFHFLTQGLVARVGAVAVEERQGLSKAIIALLISSFELLNAHPIGN